jgi:hypothetical protein
MSLRKITATVTVAAAFLTFPVVASARLSDPVGVHPKAQPTAVAPAGDHPKFQPAVAAPVGDHPKFQPTAAAPGAGPTIVRDDGGTGTASVIVIAGLALLAGVATGFGGGRVVRRRGRALQA